MKTATATAPVYCIASYPHGHGPDGVYAQRLETLIARFVGIDKPHTFNFYLLLYFRQAPARTPSTS